LIRWTTIQKEKVRRYFRKYLVVEKKLPRKNEIEKFQALYSDIFNNKDWKKIKAFMNNELKKK